MCHRYRPGFGRTRCRDHAEWKACGLQGGAKPAPSEAQLPCRSLQGGNDLMTWRFEAGGVRVPHYCQQMARCELFVRGVVADARHQSLQASRTSCIEQVASACLSRSYRCATSRHGFRGPSCTRHRLAGRRERTTGPDFQGGHWRPLPCSSRGLNSPNGVRQSKVPPSGGKCLV